MEEPKSIVKKVNRYDLLTGFIDYNWYDEDSCYWNIQKFKKEDLKTMKERIGYLIHQLSWQIWMIDNVEKIKALKPKNEEDRKKMENLFKKFEEEHKCQGQQ